MVRCRQQIAVGRRGIHASQHRLHTLEDLTTLARNFTVEHSQDPDITQEVFAFTMMPSRLRLRLGAIA
jgi:hypothetical protein